MVYWFDIKHTLQKPVMASLHTFLKLGMTIHASHTYSCILSANALKEACIWAILVKCVHLAYGNETLYIIFLLQVSFSVKANCIHILTMIKSLCTLVIFWKMKKPTTYEHLTLYVLLIFKIIFYNVLTLLYLTESHEVSIISVLQKVYI